MSRITLLSRPGCHLCDAAREVIVRVADELGEQWQEQDITADPEVLARWHDWIPVTLVDGREVDYWRIDETRLRAALGA